MMKFMDVACNAQPPATAKDFKNFIFEEFHCGISIRTAQLWLYKLGYRYRNNTALEIYNDGHMRPDVQNALKGYIAKMKVLNE